ncbi:putative zinc finger protein [Orchesella cincta]|uniref:Putative zinc finger protein n=1 Tax=Orchesella cincta TaxID=48709 RepID=A0A1D2ME84_ORCCI|nr:putative zinc finger protein [Orchesella cincta]
MTTTLMKNDMTFNDNPSDDDDFDDKEEIKFVTDFNPLDFQLPQRNHSISNTSFGPKIRTYFYICQQCSFQSNTKGKFEAHQKLHEEGSRAISCHECGRPVLPEQLERHRAKHSSMGYYQRQQSTLTVEESTVMSTSTTSQSSGKYFYQCSSCPFESNNSVRFGIHSKLHEEDSEAISCTECGFYVDPKKMTRHHAVRHKRKLGEYKTNRTAK